MQRAIKRSAASDCPAIASVKAPPIRTCRYVGNRRIARPDPGGAALPIKQQTLPRGVTRGGQSQRSHSQFAIRLRQHLRVNQLRPTERAMQSPLRARGRQPRKL